jgi:hypothetical protein
MNLLLVRDLLSADSTEGILFPLFSCSPILTSPTCANALCVKSEVAPRKSMATFTKWLSHPPEIWIYAITRRLLMVFKIRSFVQVIRSNALRGVAFMKQVLRWPFSMSQKPRHSVRSHGAAIEVESSIALFLDCADPKPAGIRFVDVFPESFHAAIIL